MSCFFGGREGFSPSDGVRWRRSFHHQGILNMMVLRELFSTSLCWYRNSLSSTADFWREHWFTEVSGGTVGGCRSSECLELDAGSNWQLVEWDKERHNMWSLGFIENQMHYRILNHLQRFDSGWKSFRVVQLSVLWQGVWQEISVAILLLKFYLRVKSLHK